MTTFKLESGAIPGSAKTIGFEGRESLGRPYAYDVFVTAEDAGALELLDVVGSRASLVVDLPEQGAMQFHGHITALSLLRMEKKLSLYKVTIEPRMSALLHSHHSRVFTKLSLKQIVSKVLEEYQLAEGEDFELKITDEPPSEEHISQYKESDLDFIHRWMEREGWTYFFDQSGSTEKMVIVDSKISHASSRDRPVRYFPQGEGDGTARDSFRELARRSSATAASVRIADYDYLKPSVEIVGRANISSQGLGELSTYGARVFTPDAATRLARIRSEEVLAGAITFHAIGAAAHLRSGTKFELYDHPRASMNGEYLITSAKHSGLQPSMGDAWGELVPKLEHKDVYAVEVQAIGGDVQYRNPSTTPWPKLDGFENASVDGAAASPYAQIDGEGRYNLKFNYDEGPNNNGKASTMVRMAQPHGGSVEGFHFPLRKGTEVICAYLGGDPDRPVIVGVVPNAICNSKVVSGNRTQNIIQTGSGNWFVLEDQQGSEWFSIYSPAGGNSANLYLGCPRPGGGFGLTSQCAPQIAPTGPNAKDLGPYSVQLWTKGSAEICAGQNLNFIAGGDMQIRAHGGEYRTYSQGNFYLDVVGAAKETYYGELTYEVQGSTTIHFEDTETTHVEQAATYEHHDPFTETVTGDIEEIYGAKKTQHVLLSTMECVGGDRSTTRKTYKSEITDGDFQFVLGSQTVVEKTGETSNVHGPKDETTGGAATLTVVKDMNWNMPANTFKAEYHSNWKASTAAIKCELVAGGTKSSTVNGTHLEFWAGNRASIAASLGYELHKVKIGITVADVHFYGAKVQVNGITGSFTASAADHKKGPHWEPFAVHVFVHVLHSKT